MRERALNWFTVGILVATAVTSGYRWWFHRTYHSPQASYIGAAPNFQIPLVGSNPYGDAPAGTLVVALSSKCTKCEEIVQFCRQLAEAVNQPSRSTKLVVVYPSGEGGFDDFLKTQNLPFRHVLPASVIGQTPAFYYVDPLGKPYGYWRSDLREADRTRMLQAF